MKVDKSGASRIARSLVNIIEKPLFGPRAFIDRIVW
jgi:hypothetical protein